MCFGLGLYVYSLWERGAICIHIIYIRLHLSHQQIYAMPYTIPTRVSGLTVFCRVMFAFYRLGSIWPVLVTLQTH